MEKDKSATSRLPLKTRSFLSADLSTQLGKLPPQAIEIEEAILGALMLEKDALTTVIGYT